MVQISKLYNRHIFKSCSHPYSIHSDLSVPHRQTFHFPSIFLAFLYANNDKYKQYTHIISSLSRTKVSGMQLFVFNYVSQSPFHISTQRDFPSIVSMYHCFLFTQPLSMDTGYFHSFAMIKMLNPGTHIICYVCIYISVG